MEKSEGLDFTPLKGAKKPRTVTSRKPQTGSWAFLSDYNHGLLSPPSSSPCENGLTAHNGSSSENLGRFPTSNNGYDRGVAHYKNNMERGSADCHRWGTSGRLEHFKGRRCWDEDSIFYQNSRSLGDSGVSMEYDETKLGRHPDKDGKDVSILKIRKEKIIEEDKFQQKPEGFSDSLKQDLDMGEFEHLRKRNLKSLDVRGQGKPGSYARCSEGVLEPAQTSASDRRNRSYTYSFDDKTVGRTKRSSRECDFSEADLKPEHQKSDPSSQENRSTKVKLKVGGVTHTLHATHDGNSDATKLHVTVKSSSKLHEPYSSVRWRERQLSEKSDDENGHRPWMEKHEFTLPMSRTDRRHTREGSRSKSSEESTSPMRTDSDIADLVASRAIRKSSRVRKRRLLDGEHGDDYNEDKVVYQKNKASKRKVSNSSFGRDYEEEAPQRRSSRVPKRKVIEGEYDDEDEEYFNNESNKNGKKKRVEEMVFSEVLHDNEDGSASGYEDIGNSDLEFEVKKKKSIMCEIVSSLVNDKKEIPLTARQRTLQSVREADPKVSSEFIEFPDGLLESGKRRKKENIPDLEQQLKKAEAAQRRRMQVEKAAKEIQAEAIRKILGQDSNRESRKDKVRKKQTELAKEKAAASMGLGSHTVRWVMGPTGTTVLFSEDTGLPSIFTSTTCRYPPPRERCAGPSCTNTYKYRDSKSNLPLCSLQCYRAVNDRTQSVTTY